jgi:hypothetical protein
MNFEWLTEGSDEKGETEDAREKRVEGEYRRGIPGVVSGGIPMYR